MMNKKKFRKLVEEGISSIPSKFLDKLDNVEIVVEQEPDLSQLRKIRARKHTLIFGLYQGVPQTKRTHYGQVLPDKITIFQKPIEKIARTEEEIKEKVKKVVWHEIAHHFGMDERRVREAERKR